MKEARKEDRDKGKKEERSKQSEIKEHLNIPGE